MSKAENLEGEPARPIIIRSLSGRKINVGKVENRVRERLKDQKRREYLGGLRVRVRLAEYFTPNFLPEEPALVEPSPLEVFEEATREILTQVFDKPLAK